MTTASTNSALDHTSDAGMQAWVSEIFDELIGVGLTQASDTGQLDPATVTRPSTNTFAGYIMFRFDDAAQATAPVFIKLWFGTGQGANYPAMAIQIATGTNGAGTLTGRFTDRQAITANSPPNSTSTPYLSRFVYNEDMGYLAIVWKLNALGSATYGLGGFIVRRTTDSAGEVTTDAVNIIANATGEFGGTGGTGKMEAISYLNNTVYKAGVGNWPTNKWSMIPLALTATLYGSDAQVFPVFQFTPEIGISATDAVALMSEVAMNSTVTLALVGATNHTFLQCGNVFGGNSFTEDSISSNTAGVLILWE